MLRQVDIGCRPVRMLRFSLADGQSVAEGDVLQGIRVPACTGDSSPDLLDCRWNQGCVGDQPSATLRALIVPCQVRSSLREVLASNSSETTGQPPRVVAPQRSGPSPTSSRG